MAKSGSNISAIEELSRLAGGLAHEIKNPLSTIKINLRLISEDLDKTDPKHARALRKLSVVMKETERLERILDDFLRYAGRIELTCQKADINEIVSDMVDFYMPQAQSNSITLRFGPAKEKLICKVDVMMFKQVLLNLLINAQQAMPSGGELIIRTHKKLERAIVEISDTGSGIEKDMQEKIFEAFFSTKAGGSGLGLATAKKIVAQHQGDIEVSSEVGKGTLFRISLPLC